MSVLALASFGFLLGVRHALEADHLAAVASLATRTRSLAEGMRLGAVWGLGHTLTLFVVGGFVLAIDGVVPERVAAGLELLVGVMLVTLGLDVLRVVARRPVRFDLHEHADGRRHLHAYRAGGKRGDASHVHPGGMPWRALFVGSMHGLAGSAALVLLALGQAGSVASGLLYIAVFGLGSILGMALLSVVVSVPIRLTSRGLGWLHGAVHAAIGISTVALGAAIVYRSFELVSWR